MAVESTKAIGTRVPAPVSLEDPAESIWRLPRRDRETLEDLLEERFVRTVTRRAKEIPWLRKAGKLLTLRDLKRESPLC